MFSQKKNQEDCVVDGQEVLKRVEPEDLDDHRAAERASIAQREGGGAWPGRPKEAKAMLMADCIRLIRNKRSQVSNEIWALCSLRFRKPGQMRHEVFQNFQLTSTHRRMILVRG